MTKKYRKKPVEIWAIQFTGENLDAVKAFAETRGHYIDFDLDAGWCALIKTLEGTMRADCGDFIICGIKGELYPCKPDIFEATYDEVEGPDDW